MVNDVTSIPIPQQMYTTGRGDAHDIIDLIWPYSQIRSMTLPMMSLASPP